MRTIGEVQPPPQVEFLPLADAAKHYGTGRTTLYRLLKEGRLKRYRREYDKRTWLRVEELEAMFRPRAEDE